ncbi:MAG: PilX N-terminal domain-containing pilus assembly protein, partial [Xanthomonadales bacterium]
MRSQGVALVTGLVILAAISLLAITAAGGLTLQRHQAANFQDRIRAESAADAAQSAALAWLYSRPDSDRQAGCIAACFLPDAIHAPGSLPVQPEFRSAEWWAEHAIPADRHPVSGEPGGVDVATGLEALWIVQEIHFDAIDPAGNEQQVEGLAYYRVLARGRGRQANTVAVSESIVARPWQGRYETAAYPPERALRA